MKNKILIVFVILSLMSVQSLQAMSPVLKGFLAGAGPSVILGLAAEKNDSSWLGNYFHFACLFACLLASGVITAILVDNDREHSKDILGGALGGCAVGITFFETRW